MIATGITQTSFISQLEVELDMNFTDEQKDLICRFGDGPTFCFADPGTGKTATAIAGLCNAELFKQIPGGNIYALSFTKLATLELAGRHQRLREKWHLAKTINFKTLHALCRSILEKNYTYLGMMKFSSTGALTMETAYSVVSAAAEETGLELNPNQIRAMIRACNALNSALIFDEDTVVTKMKFKECNVDYTTFETVRGWLFSYSLYTETISVSDLLLYTVMLLQKHPELSQQFKSQCKVMLIDEAQDLSLLQLRIISLLTDNPILIGDMKQQIYGFNGACQEIVAEFHKLYPTAVDMQLTQSFRCKNEIADFATRIILPNKIGGEDYKGTGTGGTVDIINGFGAEGLDVHGLVESISDEFLSNRRRLVRDYLFLTRNNISIIPIIEELYQKELPFRTNRFQKANEIPVISHLINLILLAAYPSNLQRINALQYVMPEFRGYYNTREHPLYKVCSATGSNIFEINYQYRDAGNAGEVMSLLMEVNDMVKNNRPVKDLINTLWPAYSRNWLSQNAWRLENKPEYYIAAVKPLVNKDLNTFLNDEVAKEAVAEESERYSRGVRCYTMHASKGLEADVVYLLDADDGLIPNKKKIDDMITKHCEIDAARAIREERALCYVACTRAKSELHIVFNGEKPAPILLGENPYKMYDNMYELYKSTGDDISAFSAFVEKTFAG